MECGTLYKSDRKNQNIRFKTFVSENSEATTTNSLVAVTICKFYTQKTKFDPHFIK